MIHDISYDLQAYRLHEREHSYGKNIHLLLDPFFISLLSKFSSEEMVQPELSGAVRDLFGELIVEASNFCFPHVKKTIRTRMISMHTEAEFEASVIDSSISVIVVDLMRAGILPSQVCYEKLHSIVEHSRIRQDHILLNREVNEKEEVVGVHISGHKIGGSVENSYVVIADPMGATGSTLENVIELYEKTYGKPKKFIALHLIVTPEYLQRMKKFASRLEVFAFRLDRGLSSDEILKTPLGKNAAAEKGLNKKDYIVPGAGGIGELLNNTMK